MAGLGDNGYGPSSMAILFLDCRKSLATSDFSSQLVQRKRVRLFKSQKGILAFYFMRFQSVWGLLLLENVKRRAGRHTIVKIIKATIPVVSKTPIEYIPR